MTSSSPLRGGFIGCGCASQYHLEAWMHVPRAGLVAVCDHDPGRLEAAVARVPEARPFRDAGARFAAGTLDFVEIASRPESHRELVERAAGHSVHILLPEAGGPGSPGSPGHDRDLRPGRRAVDVPRELAVPPVVRALRLAIDSVAIGRPIRLRIAFRDTRAIRPAGFADQPYLAVMPRLILMEMGCHLVDTARFLFGAIERGDRIPGALRRGASW